jgi:hypothetical protein
MMPSFDYGTMPTPIRSTIAFSMHRNEERSEGAQMEVDFGATPIFQPIKLEGTSCIAKKSNAAIGIGFVNDFGFLETPMPPTNSSAPLILMQ